MQFAFHPAFSLYAALFQISDNVGQQVIGISFSRKGPDDAVWGCPQTPDFLRKSNTPFGVACCSRWSLVSARPNSPC